MAPQLKRTGLRPQALTAGNNCCRPCSIPGSIAL